MEISFNTLVQSVVDGISNRYFLLFLLSMMPITELRLTIPLGIIVLKLNILAVFFVCVFANMAIGIILIYVLEFLLNYGRKYLVIERLLEKIIFRSKDKFDKYKNHKRYSLILFVGIPLPGTGAWTGSLLAQVLSLNKQVSAASIALGVILSGVIMTLLSVTGNIIIG